VVRLLADGYYYLTGREGLGYGDGKLLSLIGGLLGWRALPWVLLLGSLAGLFIGVPLTLLQRRRSAADANLPQTPIVFGPFLSLAAAAYLLVAHGLDVDALLLRALAPLLGGSV
jgi:leader peptidase (prepilin peptidase)/N-methyltransferase